VRPNACTVSGPTLADAGPNARPGCGAQCKIYARGPSEQWFYDVIVFNQLCYDHGRAKICSTALTRELSTFANVREEICMFWRERSLLTMKFIWRFYWILKRKVYLAKTNNLPKHGAGPQSHGAGPQRRGAQCGCIGCIGLRPALYGLYGWAFIVKKSVKTSKDLLKRVFDCFGRDPRRF